MASTTKFPRGLNNWAGTDKPSRMDFISDNELLNEDVMWKEEYDADGTIADAGGISAFFMSKDTYDATGEVAASGGIKAFAMTKEIYDSNGSIASSGGIQAAITASLAGTDNFSTYSHSKSGTVHTLTNQVGGNNIKFIAAGDFNAGDSFKVNGASFSTQSIDGKALFDKAFVQGAVVTCFSNGAGTLNFKTGGGETLGYRIITVANENSLPGNAKENTIAIVTNMFMTGHSFSNTEPIVKTAGHLWIKTNDYGINMNVLNRNQLFMNLVTITQSNGISYVKKDAFIYMNNIWVNLLNGIIYDRGVIPVYTNDFIGSHARATKEPACLQIRGNGTDAIGMYSNSSFDFTGFSTLNFIYTSSANITSSSAGLCILDKNATSVTSSTIKQRVNAASSSSETTVTIDISSYSGEYKVGFRCHSTYSSSSYLRIYKIFLE